MAVVGFGLSLLLAFGVALLIRQERGQIPAPLVPRTVGIPGLAVLPFANLAGDPDEQYFIDGLTEDLIANLSRISGLRFIARGSAFAGSDTDPREAAKQLGVRYMFQCSLRRPAARPRIPSRLGEGREDGAGALSSSRTQGPRVTSCSPAPVRG